MSAAAAVHASGLGKSFGRKQAVAGVDLALAHGDCLALFGPNGAGKTTLLRLAAGLLKPTSGTIHVDGVDLRADPAARALVGLVSHHTMLYAPLTARENVEFAAKLFGIPQPETAARDALAQLGLSNIDLPVRQLSRGQQQRVSLARAIVHAPSVLLLDEPYSGLDEAGAAALTSLLATLRVRGASLLMVTHNIAEGLALATHAAIMHVGRLAKVVPRGGGFDANAFAAEYRATVGAHAA